MLPEFGRRATAVATRLRQRFVFELDDQ